MNDRLTFVTRVFTVLVLAALFVAACSRTKSQTSSNTDTKTVQIPIDGMVCGSCVSNVKRALKSQKGVEEVEVSLEKRQVRVRYESVATNPERLTKTIRDLGYTPGAPSVDPR